MINRTSFQLFILYKKVKYVPSDLWLQHIVAKRYNNNRNITRRILFILNDFSPYANHLMFSVTDDYFSFPGNLSDTKANLNG